MSQRFEFVVLAGEAGVSFRELCRRFGISPRIGYKWCRRYREGGPAGLADRTRRPHHSPQRCPDEVAAAVIALRREHPTWGGRKLRWRLQALGHGGVPAASTCTEILRRAQLLDPRQAAQPWQRFERGQPNELWQLDFKGHFPTQSGVRCHPLTLLDDHSRFNLALSAERDERGPTVQAVLLRAFAAYGLPDALLCDNGAPWGTGEPRCPYTTLGVWLLRLGVRVCHGRPYHPQTQGKDERFHRTLQQELLRHHTWRDLAHCAQEFTRFRDCYNAERPHDALQGSTPLSRYRMSPRSLPRTTQPIEYARDAIVRTVHPSGVIMFQRQTWYVGRAFAGLPIGLRPSAQADGQWSVYFSHHPLGLIDLTQPRSPQHTCRSIYESTDTP